MKKILTAFAAVLLCVVCFSGCKKQSKPNYKTFERYFPSVITELASKETKETKNVLGTLEAYRSLKFVANTNWTYGLFAKSVCFHVIANADNDFDVILYFTTAEKTEELPLVVSVENGKGDIFVEPLKILSGTTSIEIKITIIGGNGIDGTLFDAQNALKGFAWGIESIDFEAEHK